MTLRLTKNSGHGIQPLAILYSALWSNLKVFLRAEYDFECPHRQLPDHELLEEETKLTSLIQLYLERSKNRPLTLDLDVKERLDLTEHPSVQLLAQESNRWKSLVFRAQAFDKITGFASLNHNSFPLLEFIEFDWGLSGWGYDPPEVHTSPSTKSQIP